MLAPESWTRSPLGQKTAHGCGGMAMMTSLPETAALIEQARTGASPRELHQRGASMRAA